MCRPGVQRRRCHSRHVYAVLCAPSTPYPDTGSDHRPTMTLPPLLCRANDPDPDERRPPSAAAAGHGIRLTALCAHGPIDSGPRSNASSAWLTGGGIGPAVQHSPGGDPSASAVIFVAIPDPIVVPG